MRHFLADVGIMTLGLLLGLGLVLCWMLFWIHQP